ncbi:helix-turn-helix domain-containing protein [Streptomyces sp. NPDC091265]|uniref:helix-turn-helix domain-containing protein n=1 Tax=unclassified Streptomyces TaxID=2593676 RepID=UPI00344B7466
MPPRRFSGAEMRNARRNADLTQHEVAAGLGLTSHVAVARWEKGQRFPPAEKLVRIADIIGVPVDILFPREGPRDLVDLRCDAGYAQGAAADAVEGLTRHVLGDAEGGRRRLTDPSILEALSALYGVGPGELEAAQDQTFGVFDPVAAPTRPHPLADIERQTLSELQRLADHRGVALISPKGGLSAAMLAVLNDLVSGQGI